MFLSLYYYLSYLVNIFLKKMTGSVKVVTSKNIFLQIVLIFFHLFAS